MTLTDQWRYVRQVTSDLQICVLPGKRMPDVLRLVARRSLSWRGCSLDVAIVGTSHTASFSRAGAACREVLACVPVAELSPPPLASGPAAGGGPGDVTDLDWSGDGLQYRFRARTDPLTRRLEDRVQTFAEQAEALYVAFPSLPDHRIAPFTLVSWSLAEDAATVYSLHGYPDEGLAVASRSTFTAGRASAVPQQMELEAMPWEKQ